jgi:hypothetical protein
MLREASTGQEEATGQRPTSQDKERCAGDKKTAHDRVKFGAICRMIWMHGGKDHKEAYDEMYHGKASKKGDEAGHHVMEDGKQPQMFGILIHGDSSGFAFSLIFALCGHTSSTKHPLEAVFAILPASSAPDGKTQLFHWLFRL